MKRAMHCTMAALACCACIPAGAAILYKSVGPNGVVQFSDLPPERGRPVQELQIGDGGSSPPTPHVAPPPLLNEEKLRAMDAAVQRANDQVDMAERALAMARRPVWSEPEPGKLTTARMTRADVERIEFCKRNVVVARQMLLEVLQQKRYAAAREPEMTASAGAPIYGPATPIFRR